MDTFDIWKSVDGGVTMSDLTCGYNGGHTVHVDLPAFPVTVNGDVNPTPVFGLMMCEYRTPPASRCCSVSPDVDTAAFSSSTIRVNGELAES